jgi:hypothetical protein
MRTSNDAADAVMGARGSGVRVATSGQAISAVRAAAHQANQVQALNVPPALTINDGYGNTTTGKSLTVEKAGGRRLMQPRRLTSPVVDQSLIALDPATETARIAANAVELARAARRKAQHESALAIEAVERDLCVNNERIRRANAASAAAYQEGEWAVRPRWKHVKLACLTATTRSNAPTRPYDSMPLSAGLACRFPRRGRLPWLICRSCRAVSGRSRCKSALSCRLPTISLGRLCPAARCRAAGQAGMPVTIDEQALGIKATGVVTMVATTPGTRGVDGFILLEI